MFQTEGVVGDLTIVGGSVTFVMLVLIEAAVQFVEESQISWVSDQASFVQKSDDTNGLGIDQIANNLVIEIVHWSPTNSFSNVFFLQCRMWALYA